MSVRSILMNRICQVLSIRLKHLGLRLTFGHG